MASNSEPTNSTSSSISTLDSRERNKLSERYKLPADTAEMDRLSLQHRMWRLLIGGLYPSPLRGTVEAALRPEEGIQRRILDIGYGSGIWAVEMAAAFPHAQVVGVDLIEPRQTDVPSNCRFEQANIEMWFPQPESKYEAAFDCVHTRSVAGHLSSVTNFIQTIAKVLKPGGILLLGDGDVGVFGPTREPLDPIRPRSEPPPQDGHAYSYFSGWLDAWRVIAARNELGEGAALEALVRESGKFEELEERTYYSPVGWAGVDVEHGEELGEIMRVNARSFVKACKDAIVAAGNDLALVEEWIKAVYEEIGEVQQYCAWHVISGIRKA